MLEFQSGALTQALGQVEQHTHNPKMKRVDAHLKAMHIHVHTVYIRSSVCAWRCHPDAKDEDDERSVDLLIGHYYNYLKGRVYQ